MIKKLLRRIYAIYDKNFVNYVTEPDHHEISGVCIDKRLFFLYCYYENDNVGKVFYYNINSLSSHHVREYFGTNPSKYDEEKGIFSEDEIAKIKDFIIKYNTSKGNRTVFYND